jgi:pimeloyl-ACP methyl ester carboxylesterase
MVKARVMGKKLELAIAILNGAVGDRLARTENGLATSMTFIASGRELPMARAEIARAHPGATSRVAVLVHGLMCTEDVWTMPDGTDYGALLARDHGFTPLYLRYNSGLAISENGAAFAALLERLVAEYPLPIDEIVPIGFSMGGLVVRGACHVASLAPLANGWLSRVKRAIYVGTPHRGAPMERVGRVVSRLLRSVDDPYTQLAAELADLRSDGVKDLGDADLRAEDRARRLPRIGLRDPRHPVPLLPQVQHYLVAGSLSTDARLASVFGDSIVPVGSATDGECVDAATFALPPEHVKIVSGLAHITLPHHPAVYEHVRAWCAPVAPFAPVTEEAT